MTRLSKLDLFFIAEVILFGLIITGVLPRETALYLGAALVIYFLAVPVEDSLVFFVRSIPLFLALPITAGFDNFNTWRVLATVIFLKWLWLEYQKLKIKNQNYILKIKNFLKPKITPSFLLIVLLITAVLSTIPALDKIAAMKRIIYFLNFAVLGMVIYDKASNKEFVKRLIRNSVAPVIIVAIVGYIQVISTYFIDIYQFMRIWGEGIQCRQFGEQWCNITVQLGNTWFAYYGEQLSLRVFSLFPDSHSFPQFVLLGIPAVLAVMGKRGARITALSFLFLITILSGTRGIWAASIGVMLLAMGIICYTKIKEVSLKSAIADFRDTLKHQVGYLVVFFIMFAVAFPILSSPQFLVGKDDSEILKARIRSIIDFGETSNAHRIEIWKKTLSSIKEKPLLGAGIGNYPVVLDQDIRLAKAGSSAHNLYLHVAAEMGLLAGIVFIWFLWLVFKRNYEIFINFAKTKSDLSHDRSINTTSFLMTYYAGTLIFVPWVLIYSLTDVAIFDERAFLIFVMTISIILGTKKLQKEPETKKLWL